MQEQNQTNVSRFFLVGFGDLHNMKMMFFLMILLIYITVFNANFLVIILVVSCPVLHFPMYIFLSQLSFSEILFTTNIVPNMLRLILIGGGTMSVRGCVTQLSLLCVPTISQCLLLATMSFDRYVAICNPLHYTSIMTFRLQLNIITLCWISGFVLALIIYIFSNRLVFCHSNIINHFYCDIAPLIELSCSDTSYVELVVALISLFIAFAPFIFIIVTYIFILVSILRIPSSFGRQKAFSTCSSHLTVVCMYYGTLTIIYLYPPGKHSLNVNKFLSLLYTLVTPLSNPIIYSLRNQDIRRAIYNFLSNCRKKVCGGGLS
ncbi:hypothetical protein XELAEV_18019345mg [Xenopus laevis]|uniref:G-protein coupled receptors family 1 profile domain-containing protein n=1 Tax=Xenopus laevis TaxID=8355 RepID=A0A974DEV7_XENLA|nr:hypothetical protein XELAEV_18019345mg [Xenopus laevis]